MSEPVLARACPDVLPDIVQLKVQTGAQGIGTFDHVHLLFVLHIPSHLRGILWGLRRVYFRRLFLGTVVVLSRNFDSF